MSSPRSTARRSSGSASPTSARPSSCGTGATGRPRHRAIVWQDRRTAARCDDLRADGAEPLIRERTGLVLDPYFSATKLEWLLSEGGVDADAALAFGTVDSWVLWNLGRRRARHRAVERQPHDAVRHRPRRVVRRAARPVRRAALVPARGATEQRALRDHRSRPRRRARACRSRASPATSRPRCSARRASRPA